MTTGRFDVGRPVALRRATIRMNGRAYYTYSFGVPRDLVEFLEHDVDYDVTLEENGTVSYRPRLEDRDSPRKDKATN